MVPSGSFRDDLLTERAEAVPLLPIVEDESLMRLLGLWARVM